MNLAKGVLAASAAILARFNAASWDRGNYLRSNRRSGQIRSCGGRAGQRGFLSSICATRALTIFLISAIGRGLSRGKWIVPLEMEKSLSSSLNDSMTEAVGNKLQWPENAANHISTFLCLNAGMP